MDFKESVTTCLVAKYANFSGRASRSEFWWFILFLLLVGAVAGFILGAIGLPSLVYVLQLAVLVPSLAVGARRLHDTGRSGWLQLLNLIPLLGGLVLLYFYVQPSSPEANQHGEPPVA